MLTPTERQAIIDDVEAGTFDLEDALNDIATKQRGEDVRKALYGGILIVNKEGKAGAVDLRARQKLDLAKQEIAKQLGTLEKQMGAFIANNSGTIQSTKRTATTLMSTATTVTTDVLPTVISLADSIANYDYIEVQYSVNGRTQIAMFTPAQLRGTAHWSEVVFTAPVLGATKATFANVVFKATCSTDDSMSVDGYKYVWSGDSSNNGNAVTLESNDNAKIMVIRGIKYTTIDSTTKDAELTDLRVGYDDEEYETAGEAIRAQIAALWEAINAISIQEITVDENGYLRLDGGDA